MPEFPLRIQTYLIFFDIVLVISLATALHFDRKCAPRHFPSRSSVCVCNSTYCDTIHREPPRVGRYFAYTSSETGKRFWKTTYFVQRYQYYSRCLYTLEIDPTERFQTMKGFGAAVTDAAAINWYNLKDPELKQSLIDSYFSEAGLQYSMLRVPIGGTDFSTHPYAYSELPKYDPTLVNFTLTPEDIRFKIPIIKAIKKASSSEVRIIATSWSPPAWMKDSQHLTGYSRLKKEYYQAYADYHCKFIEKYEEQGIEIWGVTTTNEPINGLMSLGRANSLGWSVKGMGEWISTNFGPTMRQLYPKIKIIGVDDRRFTLPIWFNTLLLEHPEAVQYFDGVGVHNYFDKTTPALLLKLALTAFPGKFVITTQASHQGINANPKVDLGSWERAQNYAIGIIEDLNNDVTGWIDWNLCLNTRGGPNWVRNYADSAVIVNASSKEFYKQPMFYIIGHFSKFVPRGSVRVGVNERLNCDWSLRHVAFLTPNNTVVVVLYNETDEDRRVALKLYNTQALLLAEARSITTVELPNERMDPRELAGQKQEELK